MNKRTINTVIIAYNNNIKNKKCKYDNFFKYKIYNTECVINI